MSNDEQGRMSSTGQPRSMLWRYIHSGRIRWAQPSLLIEESPERVVTLVVPGVVGKAPANFRHDQYVQELLTGWALGDHVWHTKRVLRLNRRDAAHALDLQWDAATGNFLGWYVNLQEPMRPSPFGYDTFDQMLDVWIEPDGRWSWKDWDELVEAEQVGLFSADEAAAIRAEGERVIASLDTLLPTG